MLTTLLPAAADAAVPTTGQIFWSEFLGTAILLLLGGGVVATNLLPKSKGKGGGWLLINWGWGLAVFAGVYVAFRTGGHLNPAVTIAKVVAHMFDPKVTLAGDIPVTGTNVAVYIVAQFLGAFAGAVTAFALVALLAQAAGGGGLRNSGQIILAGIAGSQLFNALTSLIITKSGSAEQARGIMFWLLGSLSGVRWPDVPITTTVAALGLVICLLHARALDAFTFGAEAAAALGIGVRRVQAVLLLTAALVTAVMVSVVGAIGFVGLVIPHVARLLVGVRHHRLLPASALIGALFLMLADVCSRILLKGQVLPIGVVTALVGAPVFAIILLGRRQQP